MPRPPRNMNSSIYFFELFFLQKQGIMLFHDCFLLFYAKESMPGLLIASLIFNREIPFQIFDSEGEHSLRNVHSHGGRLRVDLLKSI